MNKQTLLSGSCLHCIRAMENPRWEDFKFEPLDEGIKNRFFWLGDGSTFNEANMTGNREYSEGSSEVWLD